MKYEVEIEGRPVAVELNEREGRVSAVVGERRYEVEVLRPEQGVYLLLDGDRVYEARVWSSGAGSFTVGLRGRLFDTRIIDRKHRRASVEVEGRQQLVAPMPGKVVRVLLAAGDEVAAGQGVLVVEAMKMQNEIKSPRAGRLTEIRVSEGSTVNANQILAIVE
ncbi:MAG TPA: biotin/lipoyl-containing protein [Blastocatellia bacterium]|nr:biotin/lipoyl-containing protein [Blastocatellia bacterium]